MYRQELGACDFVNDLPNNVLNEIDKGIKDKNGTLNKR
jgi:hypothetical protein